MYSGSDPGICTTRFIFVPVSERGIKGFYSLRDNVTVETYISTDDAEGRNPLEDERRVIELLDVYREDADSIALEELLVMHERLLSHVVWRHAGSSGENYEDLRQAGYVGFMKAVQGYEPDRGARFATYAYAMIDGEIRHHHRDNGNIKIPRWARSLYARISEATVRLEEGLGREPSVEEISEEINVTPEGIHELMKLFHDTDVSSLEEDLDLSAIRSLRRESFALPVEDRIVLEQALDSLSELQRKVVYLFFYKDLTQTEIGRRLGIPQRKVSRTIASSKDALRGFLGA